MSEQFTFVSDRLGLCESFTAWVVPIWYVSAMRSMISQVCCYATFSTAVGCHMGAGDHCLPIVLSLGILRMTAVNSDHTVPRANLDPARSATVHPSSLETNAAGESAIPPRSDNNLALPRSPLIGRDHNLATLQQLLLQEHIGLLTLTGPGGIGKTRLALQVAANVLDHFVDGVYFISLASISDPELVSATIAQTLGVRESAERPLQESLQEYLRNRQAGLIALRFYQQVAPVWLKHTVSPILLNSNA